MIIVDIDQFDLQVLNGGVEMQTVKALQPQLFIGGKFHCTLSIIYLNFIFDNYNIEGKFNPGNRTSIPQVFASLVGIIMIEYWKF